MSADNGIYILRTKDQYRVAHLQAIDNILWSAMEGVRQGGAWEEDGYVPTRVVELWGDCSFTRDADQALDLAHMWEDRLGGCEYGVRVITCDKTWEQILEEAGDYAKEEIACIRKQGREDWWNMERLQRIADGKYGNLDNLQTGAGMIR